MKNGIFNFIKACLLHPSILYIFILPVYVDIRSLADLMNNYHTDLPNSFNRLLFLTDMVLVASVVSAILFVSMKIMDRYLQTSVNRDESHHGFKVIALLAAIGLVFSSTLMLASYSHHAYTLYLVMPVHFLLIKYLTNYVMIMGKTYNTGVTEDLVKNTKLSNNILSLNINFIGIIVTIFFVILLNYQHALVSVLIAIEALGVIYLCAHDKVLSSVKYYCINREDRINLKIRIIVLIAGLLFAVLVGSILYLSALVSAVLMLIVAGVLLMILKKSGVNNNHLKINIMAGLGYGVILFVIMSSVTVFLLTSKTAVMEYKYTYMLDAFFCLIVILIFLFKILKNQIGQGDKHLMHYIKYSNLTLVPFILSFIAVMLIPQLGWLLFLIIFASYAIIEYNSSFSMRQVIYKNNYSNELSSMYSLFNIVVRNGVISAGFIILLFVFYRWLHVANLRWAIIWSMVVMTLVAMVLNLVVRVKEVQ